MNKEEAIVGVAEQIQAHDLELIRFAWCDVHGVVRCKSLSAAAAMRALDNGLVPKRCGGSYGLQDFRARNGSPTS